MKIAVYGICYNEKLFVEKWFENMSPADYICVLDTGSTDGTWKMLQKLQKQNPEKVIIKQQKIDPWRFDVARNESMKLVPEDADCLVCTDFDEAFEDGWANVLRDLWQPGVTRVHYTYAWSHTATGEPTDIFTYDKIHDRSYHWMYPVHEVLWREDGENEVVVDAGTDIYLHHFQDKSKSRNSYFDLLKLSVSEFPEDSHVRMLLAREYLLRSEFKQALEEYLAVLKMPDIEAGNKRLVLLESLGRCADIYMAEGNFDEAIWYAQEFIKEDATYREPYITLAKVYNQMHMYTLAEAMAEQAFKYGTRKNTWVERADTWTYAPSEQLGIAKYNLGDLEGALKCIAEARTHFPEDVRLLQEENCYLKAQLAKLSVESSTEEN